MAPCSFSQVIAWTTSLVLLFTAIGNVTLSWYILYNRDPLLVAIERGYSYIGSDYPTDYPMPEGFGTVLMTTEDSIHYPLNDTTAAAQWASNNPSGGGYVRLGDPPRYLCVSMYHQLHCLRYLRQTLLNTKDPYASISHAQHCLNYLRQSILCHPDLTLEDPSWREYGWQPGRRGATHKCKDWSMIQEEMNLNSKRWQDWQNATWGRMYSK